MWGWKHSLRYRDQKGPHEKGKRGGFTLTATLLPKAGTALYLEGLSEIWNFSFSNGKKRIQGGHPASPALVDVSQEENLGSASRGSLGESVGSDHGGSDRNGEEDRA